MQRLARLGALVLVASALAATSARAQVPVDTFLPAPDQSGFTGFASTRTPGHLGADGTLWLDYALHSLEGKDLGTTGMLLRQRATATAIAQLGLGSRAALAVRAPFVLYQNGDAFGAQALAHAGAGNPALDARVRVYGAGVRPDGTVVDGTALALRAVAFLPLQGARAERSYIRDDAARLDLSATFDVELFGVSAGAAFTYRYRAQRPADDFSEHELKLDGGVRVPLPLIARALPGKVQESILLEVGVASFVDRMFAARVTPVSGRLAYRVSFADVALTLGVGAAFNQALGNPDFRSLLGVGYAPRKHDQDADGIIDRRDACVHLAEDRDGFEDDDGCPDDDNDGDMIVDEDDRCPMDAAEWGRDDDEDGCTDP